MCSPRGFAAQRKGRNVLDGITFLSAVYDGGGSDFVLMVTIFVGGVDTQCL